MVNTARKIIEDGVTKWIVNISFDVTREGIMFGERRSYDPRFVKTLVESKATKQAIDGGYSLVMFGHASRDPNVKMMVSENHPITGEKHFPLGRVKSASMKGKIISFELLLLELEGLDTKIIVELMKNNIGGFSTFFAVKGKMLNGIDFTFSRNFERNKIDTFLADSLAHPDMLCDDNGVCRLDATVKEQAFDIVSSLGSTEIPIEDLQRGVEKLLYEEDFEIKRIVSMKPKLKECEDNKEQLGLFKQKLKNALAMQTSLENENRDLREKLKTPIIEERIVEVEKLVRDTEQEELNNRLKEELQKRGIDVNFESEELTVVPNKEFFRDTFVSLGEEYREVDEKALGDALFKMTKQRKRITRI